MLKLIASSAVQSWSETDGIANRVDARRDFKSITFSRGAAWGMTHPIIWWHFVQNATKASTTEESTERHKPRGNRNAKASATSGGGRGINGSNYIRAIRGYTLSSFSPADIQSQKLEQIFAILEQLAHRMSFSTREIYLPVSGDIGEYWTT